MYIVFLNSSILTTLPVLEPLGTNGSFSILAVHQKTLWGTLIKNIHSKIDSRLTTSGSRHVNLKKKKFKKKKVGEDYYGIIIIHSQGYEILCNVKLIDSLLYLITEL